MPPIQKRRQREIRLVAAMQQIADWLQKLGLGQYAQRFAENDINFTVLSVRRRRSLGR